MACDDSAFKLVPIEPLSTLTNSKAKDIHGLDTAFLKQHKESIILPLVKIINKSMDENVFPSELRPAIITPVHKSGNL